MADNANLSPEDIRRMPHASNNRMRTTREMIDVAQGMDCDTENDVNAMREQIALAERQIARARAILNRGER